MTRFSYFIVASLVVGADQFIKWWVQRHAFLPRSLIPGFVHINLVHNMGGAFGVFPESGPLFLIVSSLVSGGIIIALAVLPMRGRLFTTGLALVLGGALGNLIDRVRLGYVVDFFAVRWFSVFNLADTCITVGVVLIIIDIAFGGEGNRASR